MKYLFSPWRMEYIQNHIGAEDCAFCTELSREDGPENLIVVRAHSNFVILNRYPYTSGHLMVVPYEHAPFLDGLDMATRSEMFEIANQGIQVLRGIYNPQGFNVGINIGEAAGAGIKEHIHMHIVPRWGGDTNFMSALGRTRVLPETLEESYSRIKAAWLSFTNPEAAAE
jgi:ATP adenylyltransferase